MKSRNRSRSKSDLIPSHAVLCDPSKDVKVQKALSNLSKYPHAQNDRVWRVGNKLAVLMNCQVPGCDGQRFAYTSDLWQLSTCLSPDHAGKADKKAPKAVRKSKGDRKAVRKSSGGRKGSPRGSEGQPEGSRRVRPAWGERTTVVTPR